MLKFTIFDILLFSIIGLSTLLGAYKGALKITLGVLAFLASILAVIFLFPLVGNYLGQYIENKLILNTITISLSFLMSMVIFSWSGSKLGEVIKQPGILDKFLGLILGLIRGGLFSLILFIGMIILFSVNYKEVKNAHEVINNVDKSKYPNWLIESFSFNYLENAYKNILSILPEEKLKSLTIPAKKEEIENDKDQHPQIIDQQNSIDNELELKNE